MITSTYIIAVIAILAGITPLYAGFKGLFLGNMTLSVRVRGGGIIPRSQTQFTGFKARFYGLFLFLVGLFLVLMPLHVVFKLF